MAAPGHLHGGGGGGVLAVLPSVHPRHPRHLPVVRLRRHRLLEWHRNPIDFYFQTALMNSRLRRRHVRQAIGEQWAK